MEVGRLTHNSASIVGETFAKLNESNAEQLDGDRVGHSSQGRELLSVGQLPIRGNSRNMAGSRISCEGSTLLDLNGSPLLVESFGA